MRALASASRQMSVLLDELTPQSLSAEAVTLRAQGPFVAVARSRTPELEVLARRCAGSALRVEIVGGEAAGPDEPATPQGPPPNEHPLVLKALSLLGGRIVGVSPRRDRAKED